jgi:ERCC4-related helicase
MSDMVTQFFHKLQEIDEFYQSRKLPKFRITLKGAANNISNLLDILIRKSLVKLDAYNYDGDEKDKVNESFSLPDEKAFMENEKSRVIYDRLKATVNALELQAGSMPETLDEFTEEYLENCRKIVEYFAFHNYSSANNMNTRTLKELTDKVVGGNDEIFRKVMQDNIKLLSDTYRSIQS